MIQLRRKKTVLICLLALCLVALLIAAYVLLPGVRYRIFNFFRPNASYEAFEEQLFLDMLRCESSVGESQKTNAFLASPDKVLICKNDRVVSLSQNEWQPIYDMLMDITTNVRVWSNNDVLGDENAKQATVGYPCIKFCYRQSWEYVSDADVSDEAEPVYADAGAYDEIIFYLSDPQTLYCARSLNGEFAKEVIEFKFTLSEYDFSVLECHLAELTEKDRVTDRDIVIGVALCLIIVISVVLLCDSFARLTAHGGWGKGAVGKVATACISLVCLLSILFAIFWFVPYLRVHVLKVPQKTEALFPKPDAVVLHYAGQDFTLTASESEVLYQTLLRGMADMTSCEYGGGLSMGGRAIYFEFQYHNRYQYVGDANGKEPFTFDALSMTCENNRLCLIPKLDGIAYNLDESGLAYLRFQDTAVYADMIDLAERYTVERLLQIPRDLVDEQAAESNIFPAKPDVLILYREGHATELTGEKLAQLYEKCAATVENSLVWFSLEGAYHCADMVQEGVCIELRYHKRRTHVARDLPSAPSKNVDTLQGHFDGLEYDALLFVILKSKYPGQDEYTLHVIPYLEGKYGSVHYRFSYDELSMQELMATVTATLHE